MPGGDRTGPMGQGQMTGRGLGFCSGSDAPGAFDGQVDPRARAGWGRGQGHGYGYGRGCGWGRGGGGRNRFRARGPMGRGMRSGWSDLPVSAPAPGRDARADLQREAEVLRARLESLEARLEELSPPPEGDEPR